MKVVLFLSVLVAALAAVLARPDEPFYSSRYDSFDAQELVGNIRLLKSYGHCFLGKGPCTAEGSDFKKMIPDALMTSCAKCSPKQREIIRTVVKAFKTKLPELWTELAKKEDPSGQYKAEFNKFLDGSD